MKVAAITTGNPLDDRTKMGPMVRESDARRIASAVIEQYRAKGETPPIVMSGNIDGATERNRLWFERYRGRLRYR